MKKGLDSDKRVLHYHKELWDPKSWLNFVQMPLFTKRWKKLGMDDDDLRALEVSVMADPNRPPGLSGAGPIKKIRFAAQRSDSGKSGSARVLYSHFEAFGVVFLWICYGKNETSNISPAVAAQLLELHNEIEELLRNPPQKKRQ